MVQSFLLAHRYFCFPGKTNVTVDIPVSMFPMSLSLSISREKGYKVISCQMKEVDREWPQFDHTESNY